jgi:hypothetical protein
MAFISILLFFLYTYGLGFGATFWMKNSDNFFERQLVRIGIGLGILPLLMILFNLLHIPISQEIFIALSLLGPVVNIAKERKFTVPSLKLTKSNLAIMIAVLIFFASLFIYSKGAFSYPYLEDDDSWGHAAGAAYVASAQVVHASEYRNFQYIDPYPPGYDGLFGLLKQSNDSIYWTLKFFNALIISLSVLFFYFFAKEFTGSISKALFATFILAAIPCYLSHFIWAHALSMVLFFPAMYCLEMIRHDRKWIFPAGFAIAGMLASEATTSFKLAVMIVIYVAIKCVSERKFSAQVYGLVLGAMLSLAWWAIKFKAFFGMAEGTSGSMGQALASNTNIFSKLGHFLQSALPAGGGTASKAYSFNDFFIAQSQNLVNNPIGIGVAISILAFIGMIFVIIKYRSLLKEKRAYLAITVLWLIFAFLGVNSVTFHLPVGLFAFRFWMVLAVPVALLAAEAAIMLSGFFNFRLAKAGIIIALIAAVVMTGGVQKYAVNTATWNSGAFWTSADELQGYIWLFSLQPETKVFSFLTDDQVIGFDKFSCGWCKDEAELRKNGLNISGEDMHAWMLEHGYQYLLIGGMEVKQFGENATSTFIDSVQNSKKFTLAHQTNGLIILKA